MAMQVHLVRLTSYAWRQNESVFWHLLGSSDHPVYPAVSARFDTEAPFCSAAAVHTAFSNAATPKCWGEAICALAWERKAVAWSCCCTGSGMSCRLVLDRPFHDMNILLQTVQAFKFALVLAKLSIYGGAVPPSYAAPAPWVIDRAGSCGTALQHLLHTSRARAQLVKQQKNTRAV